uniref:Uncharacterized protein n=1 Tax=Cacopsylla melanoneura TaxID=428564 RepID=A0A8D8T731_9HEMI
MQPESLYELKIMRRESNDVGREIQTVHRNKGQVLHEKHFTTDFDRGSYSPGNRRKKEFGKIEKRESRGIQTFFKKILLKVGIELLPRYWHLPLPLPPIKTDSWNVKTQEVHILLLGLFRSHL